jgi:O-antigen ligase
LTRILGGVAFVAAVMLVLALPLVWNAQALDPFRGPKRDLALAAWATLAAVFMVGNARGRAWSDSWWALWGGVVAGGAISAVASGHFVRVLASLLPLVLAALGWGALRQLPESQRAKLTKLVLWAGVIQAAAVLAFLNPGWQPTSFAALNLDGGRYAFIGSLGNPADVAVFLLLPAVLAAQKATTVRRARWLHAAVAILLVGVIVATRTLTVVAALAAGLAALAWQTAPRRYRGRVLALGAALLIVLVVATPLRGRLAEALRESRQASGIWIGSGRAAGSAAAISMLAARPLTGVGFDQFEANSFRFQSLAALAERGSVLRLQTAFGEAHDELLQYGAETGLVGLALAIVGLVYAWRRRPPGGGTVARVAPLLAAALITAITQFPLHLAAIAAQWAVLAAFLLPPLPAPPVPSRRTAELRLAFALTLAALATMLAWQRYGARLATGQAKQLIRSLREGSTPVATRPQVARAALSHLLPRAVWLPDSWEAHLVVGNLAVEARDRELALRSFAAALAMVERPEVQFDVGTALLLTGDQEAGMAHLVRAVELNPTFFRQIKDPELSRALRRHLDALGYGEKQAWMYEGTPAATP